MVPELHILPANFVTEGLAASPRRWLMISLVFAATVMDYLDRQALSIAAPVLMEQFHMSAVAYSRVLFGSLA